MTSIIMTLTLFQTTFSKITLLTNSFGVLLNSYATFNNFLWTEWQGRNRKEQPFPNFYNNLYYFYNAKTWSMFALYVAFNFTKKRNLFRYTHTHSHETACEMWYLTFHQHIHFPQKPIKLIYWLCNIRHKMTIMLT